ncbi:MAG: hypothetical protein ACI4SF_10515 [Oscillospiraceae bacterium]
MNTNDSNYSLFDDIELDEMQKNKNYEIGFKLFRNFLCVVIFAAYCIFVVTRENTVSVISGALFFAAWIFYLIYAARAAKEGVMNIKFAKAYTREWMIPLWIVLIVLCIVFMICLDSSFRSWLLDTIMCIFNLVLCVLAKKNMRVLAEQIKEEE